MLFNCSCIYRRLFAIAVALLGRISVFLGLRLHFDHQPSGDRRLLDEFGGSVVVYPALIFLAAAMVLIGAARSNGMLLSGALVLGLGFATITSACHALAVFVSPQKYVGRATATYFVLLDVGVGIGPYTLGLLVPYFGFSAVYFAAAAVAAAGILIYWAVIGRTGIFSTLVMRKVRSVRLNQIEIDPRHVSSAYRRGEEIEFDDPQPNQKKDA